ncbi:MAG: hypothetical protein K2H73_08215 [Treponemataceae bacterium]|nr:hypothetical protein [Treponemataceae bacterium]
MQRYAKKMAAAVRHVLCCAGLCAGVLFVAAPFSCKMTDEGVAVSATDKDAPKIVSFRGTQRSVLAIACDEPMTLTDVAFKTAGDGETFAQVTDIAYDESGQNAELTLDRPMEIGEKYALTGIVADANGNTLAFSLPFTGYNDHPAHMMLTELRYGTSDKTAKQMKVEFIEFYVLAGGNLAGLELYGGYYGEKTRYALPAIEVKEGEYVTVHLRNYGGDADETGDALDLPSDSPDASETARDLWVNGTDGGYFTKNDVVALVDAVSGNIMDAVLLTEDETKTAWSKKAQTTLAEQAVAAGVWQGNPDRSSAATSKGMGVTKTLSRQNVAAVVAAYAAGGAQAVTASKADWTLAAATPGKENVSQ